MRSMRSPLGNADPRVAMIEPPIDTLLSPSFASVLAFDEPDEPRCQDLIALDEDLCQHNMGWQDQPGLNSSRESSLKRGSVKRPQYPRLELDVAKDRYHALDGPAEPSIPCNTPDSANGSPNEWRRGLKADNLRIRSAPQAPVLTLDWLEDRKLIYQPSEGKGKNRAQKHCLSVSAEPRSTSPTTTGNFDCLTVSFSPIKGLDEITASRCVRFSPPEAARHRSPRPGSRPLPSVERKQDYISLYRQQKQHEKWKKATRVLARPVSPRRSPVKVQVSTSLNQQPEIPFPSLSKMLFRQDDLATPTQGTNGSQFPDASPVLADVHYEKEASPREKVHDLVALNFGLYRPRNPEHLPRDSKWAFVRVRMSPTFIPASGLLEETQEMKQIICRLPAEDLLLHFIIVLPYFFMRIPLTALAKAGRLANSQAGLTILDIFRIVWSFTAAFIQFTVQHLWNLTPGHHAKVKTKYRDKARRH
ncbi:hypothetical protein N7520_011907 [Penicillium odoratum]|uniref:uncharacterized protein n=1 Tax=Penicillium odoratum TaxID=1167516 RepID=UPI0025478F9F|nr:uncharacterized protein N7520_011907 [Penicillium odoratum]KAJ5746725.1 hypothetical protein N7520_011907 [Penicillium odoratum]